MQILQVDGNETVPAKVGVASEADLAVHHAGTTTTDAGTTTTEAPPALIDPPPPSPVDDVTKVGEADLAVHHAGTTTIDARTTESSGTTTTPAGPTTVTATESPPALMHPLPPPLGDELTKQAQLQTLPKAMDSTQTPFLVATKAKIYKTCKGASSPNCL